jgi:hypothetical protein
MAEPPSLGSSMVGGVWDRNEFDAHFDRLPGGSVADDDP